MTERSKSWLRDNVMGIIIAVMFTAFWVQYESNRKAEHEDKKEITKTQTSQCYQLTKMTMVILADPDTDAESKEVLREYLKIESRGTKTD